MSQEQHHIIQRQIVELDCTGSEPEGRQWQERMSRFAREELGPVLQDLLDRSVPPGVVLRLDRLEIVANVSFDNGQWTQTLAKEIARQIREKLPAGSHDPGPGVRQLTAAQSVMEQFFFFLKTGRLPWQAGTAQPHGQEGGVPAILKNNSSPAKVLGQQDLEGAVTKVLQQNDNIASGRETFLELIGNEKIRQRLTGQFSLKMLALLANRFFPEHAFEMAENHSLVIALADTFQLDKARLETIFWETVFENKAQVNPERTNAVQAFQRETDEPNLAHQTLHHFLKEYPRKAKSLAEIQKDIAPAPVKKFIESPIFKKMVSEIAGKQRQELVKPASQKKTAPENDNSPSSLTKTPGDQEQPSSLEKTISEVDSIYVDNAGVVLLHPFLPAFFDGLKISKKGRILKPDRAVHLLQFLATGQAASPEFLLPLNKVLCGLPLDEPVPARVRLSKKEKTEAYELLEAVIRHWAVLKNTSTEGLQGTFLCRAGALSQKADGDWLLSVEQKPFDVLLESLPWSISIVKLPWMERLLWVEWG